MVAGSPQGLRASALFPLLRFLFTIAMVLRLILAIGSRDVSTLSTKVTAVLLSAVCEPFEPLVLRITVSYVERPMAALLVVLTLRAKRHDLVLIPSNCGPVARQRTSTTQAPSAVQLFFHLILKPCSMETGVKRGRSCRPPLKFSLSLVVTTTNGRVYTSTEFSSARRGRRYLYINLSV